MASFAVIWIGTSGFQYPEWKGKFYPEDLSAKKMLRYYAGRFPTTEINYSFYRIPSEKTLAGWAGETPPTFRFSLKAPQQITHVRKLRDCAEVLTRFWEVASGLGHKLGVILFQLPPYLRKDGALFQEFLGTLPRAMKCAFEFRHPSWFDDEILNSLRASGVALCIADTEKLTTPVVATAGYNYFRLRNTNYTQDDLKRWAAVIQEQARQLEDVYVYFKHEESGVGPEFAKQMMALLDLAR